MTALHGKNLIGDELSAEGSREIFGFDPRSGQKLPTTFREATLAEINRAMLLASEASGKLREADPETVARLLEAIADEITALGDELIEMASTESGLPGDRITGERGRTVGQLRLFASVVRDGAYLDVRIDTAMPDRKPLPRPDLRRILIPIGPVVVFGASNFPLAFSVAGGDTASALAARNPVVVKAHPAHPGTSELTAAAIHKAVQRCGLHPGVFSLLHGADPKVSIALVEHPETAAVSFTGSEHAGRAIFDAASRRPNPIHAYVEMGSTNPVFVLPGALKKSPEELAKGLFASINLGVGQFCTSPGVIIGKAESEFEAFKRNLASLFQNGAPGTMLHKGILKGYNDAVEARKSASGVAAVTSSVAPSADNNQASPVLFETDLRTWLNNPELANEVFGPSAVVIPYASSDELLRVARTWKGTLTATIFGTPEDLAAHRELIEVLSSKAGRLIFNAFPTGVEVSHAMHHGGPYPATADPKFTSVGTAAILRFLRPVCYQNFPEAMLPLELHNSNPRRIWRLINGELTREAIQT